MTLSWQSKATPMSYLILILILIIFIIIIIISINDQVDFSVREHTERSKAVWSTASFQLKLVNNYDDHVDDEDDDHGDDDDGDDDYDDALVPTRRAVPHSN